MSWEKMRTYFSCILRTSYLCASCAAHLMSMRLGFRTLLPMSKPQDSRLDTCTSACSQTVSPSIVGKARGRMTYLLIIGPVPISFTHMLCPPGMLCTTRYGKCLARTSSSISESADPLSTQNSSLAPLGVWRMALVFVYRRKLLPSRVIEYTPAGSGMRWSVKLRNATPEGQEISVQLASFRSRPPVSDPVVRFQSPHL